MKIFTQPGWRWLARCMCHSSRQGMALLLLIFIPRSAELGEIHSISSRGAWKGSSSSSSCSSVPVLLGWAGRLQRMQPLPRDPSPDGWSPGSSCTPGNCRDVPAAPLPLCPQEGLKYNCSGNYLSLGDSVPGRPCVQLYGPAVSSLCWFREFNMQLIFLRGR